MITVLCNGVFDVLHNGHLEHLRQAKGMGDRLIVAVTLDEFVNKGPGRPFNKWAERADMLRELRCVDDVIESRGAVLAVKSIRPTYFVKGMDYADGKHWTEDVEAACREVGTELRFTTTDKTSIDEIIRRALRD
jgi:cytidyltransferase-like protein